MPCFWYFFMTTMYSSQSLWRQTLSLQFRHLWGTKEFNLKEVNRVFKLIEGQHISCTSHMLEYTDVSYFAFSHFALCIFHILYFALCSGRVYGGRLAGRPVGEGSDYDRVTLGVTIELATTQYTTNHKIQKINRISNKQEWRKKPEDNILLGFLIYVLIDIQA